MSVSQPGPIPPCPEPFWNRSWRTLWRWRPYCVRDGQRFKTQGEFDEHWLTTHHKARSQPGAETTE